MVGECLFRAGRVHDLGQLLETHPYLCEDPRIKTLQARWMSRSGNIEGALTLFRGLMALPEAQPLYRLCSNAWPTAPADGSSKTTRCEGNAGHAVPGRALMRRGNN